MAACLPDSEPLKRAAVALGAPSVASEPPRQLDVELVEVDVADALEEL